jgi:uncharacterized oxidoreductase
MKLDGQTILITGGSSGIGLELAGLLAPRNTVVVTGRNATKLKAARTKIPSLHTIESDVSDSKAVEALLERVRAEFPATNILVNNAGIMRVLNLLAPNDAGALVGEIHTNLMGPVQMVQRFLPHLLSRPEAAIVNITSGLAYVPLAACPIYCATKAALRSYTQSLRVQLRGTHVKVFEVAPPATKTDLDKEFPDGIADRRMYMDVGKLAKATIRGVERDKLEIRPGLSTVLHAMHRIAPGLTLTSKGAERVVSGLGPI